MDNMTEEETQNRFSDLFQSLKNIENEDDLIRLLDENFGNKIDQTNAETLAWIRDKNRKGKNPWVTKRAIQYTECLGHMLKNKPETALGWFELGMIVGMKLTEPVKTDDVLRVEMKQCFKDEFKRRYADSGEIWKNNHDAEIYLRNADERFLKRFEEKVTDTKTGSEKLLLGTAGRNKLFAEARSEAKKELGIYRKSKSGRPRKN